MCFNSQLKMFVINKLRVFEAKASDANKLTIFTKRKKSFSVIATVLPFLQIWQYIIIAYHSKSSHRDGKYVMHN